MSKVRFAAAAAFCFALTAGSASAQNIPFFQPDGEEGVGYLALNNISDDSVTVTLSATDDAGNAAPGGNITATLDPLASLYLSSANLENGSSSISGAFGNGTGFWHITITATNEITAQNFLYTPDGALNELTTPLTANTDGTYDVKFFTEPGASVFNTRLRLLNRSSSSGTITVTAREASGNAVSGSATVTLDGLNAVDISSADLFSGNASLGVSGGLAAGDGFWILTLDPTMDITAFAIAVADGGQIADIGTGVSIAGSGSSSACAADDFLDVNIHPENLEYPAPELSAECSGDMLVVTTNNIPNFEFVATTPSDLEATEVTFNIPLTPTVDSTPDDVPTVGQIGVTIGGLFIYAPNESPDDGLRDPILDELQDFCNGHTGNGIYHHHSRPDCIVPDAGTRAGVVLGYAFDGYPIMHPYECTDITCNETFEVQSSYQFIGGSDNAYEQNEYVEGLGDLDECNGMTRPDGTYAYYMTDTFPYTLRCYHGNAEGSNFAGPQGGGGGGMGGGGMGGGGN